MNRMTLVLGGLALVLFVAASAFFTVHQTQQVLITQFGEPIRVVRTPGLNVKVPLVQTVIPFDRRLLDYDAPGEEVILGDQRRLIVDSFTRYRITDPLLFYQTVGAAEQGIRARLSSIVSSSLRRVLGSEGLVNVLSAERGRVMGEIRRQVDEEARRFGIEVVDVRIRRADLPDENTQAILNRMQSERERVAREARAEGAEVAARVRAQADRDRTVLLAEAEANAAILRGSGEQEAIGVFAEAFRRDPEFFQFWRTMQAYREVFANGESRMVLTPESDFFRFFREIPTIASPAAAATLPPGGAAPNGAAPQPAAPPAAPAAQPEPATPAPAGTPAEGR
ncbi:protease modulator HflC [Sabulicella glaciei]|uniref:Protein HflC n=1 Tax=Sabulicella glaciei TaxID=2984948 RepID=A0ABT3NZA1_9PROT|nr:protease modulator HflC [Roseococcus sp. MDT2-1-1]MCW8087463.1 protease modulator HflC [Roseococcus sp. MDT2-1-1]